MHFSQVSTIQIHVGFYVGFHLDVLLSPRYLPPRLVHLQGSPLHLARYVQFLLNHYIVYIAKRLVIAYLLYLEPLPRFEGRRWNSENESLLAALILAPKA